ncbi:magnesium-translocating P-type ATPase [Senna tora]|uniref:Magnesium-translocating P-type ATPase n=1 Tax=Senna tora TaxID=362788 RepID=A0A834WB86_9FABA|nr:magnesium-translocating P-type ATPase [Senna tora]
MIKQKEEGPTGSRTQVAGFKVQSANHYTIEP